MNRAFRAIAAAALILGTLPDAVQAQTTQYRVALGASAGITNPSRQGLDTTLGVGPILRFRPRRGLSQAFGFSWFRTENEQLEFRIKPFMAGVGYNVPVGRAWISPSFVAGISINRAEVKATGEKPRLTNSFAMRPGLSLWYDISDRVGLNTFAGYVITRPDLSFGNAAGSPPIEFKADAFVWTAGLAVWIF